MADNFGLSGPTHITVVDWNNSLHRRSIAASLVQGVYILEQGRLDPAIAHLASTWWEAFNFRVSQLLVDPHDQSYFGAIYDFCPMYPQPAAPRHVIAFRGNILKPGSSGKAEDFKLNIQCLVSNLQDTPRFHVALENVSRVVSCAGGPGTVWLAGHSLGSSLALVIGRNTARQMSIHLESYLFNPPFASLPIKNEKLKTGLRFANTVITAGLAKAAAAAAAKSGSKAHEIDAFSSLGSWIPYLFVNQGDSVCSEYIGYFEHREKLESMGVGKIGKLATKHSIGSIVSAARGKDVKEAVHLIPSAYLTVNCTPCYNYREAHEIHQWWKPDLELKHKLYQLK